MVAKIQLYRRQALPPERAGVAKPPASLADRSGQIQAGQAIAGIGMKIWSDIIKSQAANEEAEGVGQMKALTQSFDTFVADNPNASEDELKKEWGKIETRIKGIPNTFKTGLGKSNMTNTIALNMPVVREKAWTQAAATKSKQELARSEAIVKNHKVNFEYEELAAHYGEQVQNGVYDRETIFGPDDKGGGRLDTEIVAMRKIQEKLIIDAKKEPVFGAINMGLTAKSPEEAKAAFTFARELKKMPGPAPGYKKNDKLKKLEKY